ncbi:hypothetical protein BGZ68_001595, partial [Mortierella alpina]
VGLDWFANYKMIGWIAVRMNMVAPEGEDNAGDDNDDGSDSDGEYGPDTVLRALRVVRWMPAHGLLVM